MNKGHIDSAGYLAGRRYFSSVHGCFCWVPTVPQTISLDQNGQAMWSRKNFREWPVPGRLSQGKLVRIYKPKHPGSTLILVATWQTVDIFPLSVAVFVGCQPSTKTAR